MVKGVTRLPVTDAEVSEAIKYLKNGKAAGPDLIGNEMIKYGHNILIKPITIFFATWC